jgi:hypothetical protein
MSRLYFNILFFTINIYAQVTLPDFTINNFNEQELSFSFEPGIKVLINAPPINQLDNNKPAGIILYALPNGNTTAWTVGKKMEQGDDWHFGIQNIGAQTRFARDKIEEYNVITVYLENDQKSWPAWKAATTGYDSVISTLVDTLLFIFREHDPFIILSGHSGGGRFIFSFLDAHDFIPPYVKRICFLDSNYGYDSTYTEKLITWLNASSENYLCVLAYNDSNVVLNGKNIVSPTGGTWYRSRKMQQDLSTEFRFTTRESEEFIYHSALRGRINITLHKNPRNEIFHTVQVEKNGFIHSLLTGTSLESDGYIYFGERAYR